MIRVFSSTLVQRGSTHAVNPQRPTHSTKVEVGRENLDELYDNTHRSSAKMFKKK